MPAYRERVYVCPRENGQPARIVDVPLWWDRRAFFEQFGQRQIDTGNPFYVDCGLLLSGAEASARDRHRREAVSDHPASQEPSALAAMERLAAVLKTAS
ncbi:MAG: hypothetical protein R3300_21840 [Candidatus Promineifilaceae bacterium]|nr:hypothetical protein [Candidatus Promineifilaceae bacterium]